MQKEFISICLPTKTGSSTIENSFPFEYLETRMHILCWMQEDDKKVYKEYIKK